MNLKDFIEYLFNKFKFWIIINEWESGVLMRCGRLKRVLSSGIYLKIPIIDFIYIQSNRVKEIALDQINLITKDKKDITISLAIHYRIIDVYKFYNSYSEPNEVIAQKAKSLALHLVEIKELSDINTNSLSGEVLLGLDDDIDGTGVKIDDVITITATSAKVIRLIMDKSYNNRIGELFEQVN